MRCMISFHNPQLLPGPTSLICSEPSSFESPRRLLRHLSSILNSKTSPFTFAFRTSRTLSVLAVIVIDNECNGRNVKRPSIRWENEIFYRWKLVKINMKWKLLKRQHEVSWTWTSAICYARYGFHKKAHESFWFSFYFQFHKRGPCIFLKMMSKSILWGLRKNRRSCAFWYSFILRYRIGQQGMRSDHRFPGRKYGYPHVVFSDFAQHTTKCLH